MFLSHINVSFFLSLSFSLLPPSLPLTLKSVNIFSGEDFKKTLFIKDWWPHVALGLWFAEPGPNRQPRCGKLV